MLAAIVTFQLAACGSASDRSEEPPAEANQAAPESAVPRIPCAAAGTAELAPVCTVERAETPAGVVLTLRHPEGAFHRIQITQDGRGVIAADGAEPAKVTPFGTDRIEVEVGGARYRLPAIVRQ